MTSKRNKERNKKRSGGKRKNAPVVRPVAKEKAVEKTGFYSDLEHKMNETNKDTMGKSTPIILEEEKIKPVVETIKSVVTEMSVISDTKIDGLKKIYIAERARAVEKVAERVEKEKTVASLTAILETMLTATQATVSETIELAEEMLAGGVLGIIFEAPEEIKKKKAEQEDLEALARCSSKMLKGMAIVLKVSRAGLSSSPENEQVSTRELMVTGKILEIGRVLSTVIEGIEAAHCNDCETKEPTFFDPNALGSLKSASYKVLEIAEQLIKKDDKVEWSEAEYANSMKEIDETLEIIKGFIKKDDKVELSKGEYVSSDKGVAFLSATDRSILSIPLRHPRAEEQRSAELKDMADIRENKNGEPAAAVTHEHRTEERQESFSEQDTALEKLEKSNEKPSDRLSNQALSIKNTITKILEAAEQITQTVDCVSSVKGQVEKLRQAVQKLRPELTAIERGKNPILSILSTKKSVGKVSKRALRLVKEMTEAEPAIEVSTIVATTVSAMKLAKMELGLLAESLHILWLVYTEEEVKEKAEPLSVLVRETACSVSELVRHTHDSMEKFISEIKDLQSKEDDVKTIAAVKSLTNTITKTLKEHALIVSNIFSLASPLHTQAHTYSQDLLEDISQRLDHLAKELGGLTIDEVDAKKRLEYLLKELGKQTSAEKTQQILVKISEQLLEQKKPAEKEITTPTPLSSKEKFLICLYRTISAIFATALFLSSLYFLVVATNVCYELAFGRGFFPFPTNIAHFTSHWLMLLALPVIYCIILFTDMAHEKMVKHNREVQIGRISSYVSSLNFAVFASNFMSSAFVMTAYSGYLFTLPGGGASPTFAMSLTKVAVCLFMCASLSLALFVLCATSFLYTMSMDIGEHKKQTTEGMKTASLPISEEDLCLPPETDIVSPNSETVTRSESAVVAA